MSRRLCLRKAIYDCMDELSAFLGATKQILQREKEFLACADVIFAGQESLYEAKRLYLKAVYCFPWTVDAARDRSAS